ncbi:MAG: phosphatase PAP2 family protein [Gorillibacterium sp.]|nr:phosphatase PAP2 family protein [Gorillibacterium sp.]
MLEIDKKVVTITRKSKRASMLWIGGWFLTISSLIIFLLLARGISSQWVFDFDTAIFSTFRSVASGKLTRFARVVTELGTLQFQLVCFVCAIMIGLWFKRVRGLELLLLCLSGAWIINVVLKALFHRARPILDPYLSEGGYSFPSGHAMSSMAFYGLGGYLLWKVLRGRMKAAWLILVLTGLLIIVVGWSRIYLGVHFASDVIAGFTAGLIWLIICLTGNSQLRMDKSPT